MIQICAADVLPTGGQGGRPLCSFQKQAAHFKVGPQGYALYTGSAFMHKNTFMKDSEFCIANASFLQGNKIQSC